MHAPLWRLPELPYLATARQDLGNLASDVTTEFDRLQARFGAVGQAALSTIDTQRTAAAADVMQGRAAAMQSAVQGIQGNINSSIAKIQANPNLSAGQKASMIAQTRLAGASAIAPAIGANILAFNQLAADVATKFGSFTAQIESTIISGEAQLGQAQGAAFTQATVAAQEIGSQLLRIQANSDVAFAGASATLEGIRTQANLGGDQLLLENLPNTGDPVLNLTDASSTSLLLSTNLVDRDFQRRLGTFGLDVNIALARSQQGTPWSRVADAFSEGFASGELVGGFIGAGAQLGDEVFNPPAQI